MRGYTNSCETTKSAISYKISHWMKKMQPQCFKCWNRSRRVDRERAFSRKMTKSRKSNRKPCKGSQSESLKCRLELLLGKTNKNRVTIRSISEIELAYLIKSNLTLQDGMLYPRNRKNEAYSTKSPPKKLVRREARGCIHCLTPLLKFFIYVPKNIQLKLYIF